MRFIFASVALLVSTMSGAATPIDGWYSGIFGGYAYVPNNIHTNSYGVTRSNATYWSGYDAGGSIGFKSHPMRYEGELTYINANLKSFKINHISQTGVGGYNNAILAMANVYYDFPNQWTCLQPFLGLGIGYGWIHAKLNSQGPQQATQFSGSNVKFAYQGTGGLIYNFSENYAINIGYRYITTVHVNSLGKLFQAQLGNLGVVYRFDGSNYK